MTKTLLFLAIITIFSLACRENRSSGGYKHESKDIATGDVDAIKSKIAFKAGILNIKPVDTEKIIKTSFDYFRDKWKPEVNYEVDDRTGYLEILSHGSNWNINFDEDDRVAWNIGINRHIQNDLSIKVGAGEIDIDLQDCNIHRFDIDMGAGEAHINLRNTSVPYLSFDGGAGSVEIDLSGRWENDLDANIDGGVGEITLILPPDIGIEMDVSGILGDRDIPGFFKDGSLFTNELNGKTKNNLFLDINGGIGTVKVITE